MKKLSIFRSIERVLNGAKTVFLHTMHHKIEVEGFDGWHLRMAMALRRYAGIESVLINPGDFGKPKLKILEGFPVIFLPYVDFN